MPETMTTERPVEDAADEDEQIFDPSLFNGFVIDPLAHWASLTPDKLALVARGAEYTYASLHHRTNQIARALRQVGIGRGDRVAFVLNRGPKTVLLLIGILKAGAAYVPLDATSPVSRIKDCIEDAQPGLVILDDARAVADIHSPGFRVVTLDELFHNADVASGAELSSSEATLKSADTAYIIFTSGSTGRPKGVPVTHAALQNFVCGNQRTCIRVHNDDIVLQGFSPASDGHHEEVWPTLLAGATIAVAGAKEVYSGPDLSAFLNDFKVTVVSCAPTMFAMLDEDVPSVRKILFGAENLPASLVQRWWRPNREILNTYGPTEATVGATFSICTPDAPITIGKPLPNYYAYVLDETLQHVKPGLEGELCISGIGVSTGYIGREELSSSKFVENPHAVTGRYNQTLYRTGDRARLDDAGNIIWLGRMDSQIKIRGHRVELSEIEGCIAACRGVKSGVVVVRQPEAGDALLAALIVTRDGDSFQIGDVLDRLRDTLPAHMVPQVLEQVEKIPRLPSGKVDRAACQLLHGQVFRIEREIVPPRTESERLVTEAWRELFSAA